MTVQIHHMNQCWLEINGIQTNAIWLKTHKMSWQIISFEINSLNISIHDNELFFMIFFQYAGIVDMHQHGSMEFKCFDVLYPLSTTR